MTALSNSQPKTPLQQTPIAIIGMAALFAKSGNLREYWENILKGTDCMTDVPQSAWNIDDYYDPDPKTPDKTYAKRGGFLPEIDFDPLEFGLPPDTLQAIDSAQLLSLVVAKQALEDAGYGKREFNRDTTGVILGAAGICKMIMPLTNRLQYPVWEKALRSSGIPEEKVQKTIEKIKSAYIPWEENSFPGMLNNVISGRITNRLDLGGTNCTVDAACASSLSALKMSISELSERRCDMMITGGVDTDNSIVNYLCFSKTPALSKKGSPTPFDVSSDGMMVGEGIGMLILKRLEDAQRDGDRIYAVIRGIGTASDGRYKSIYAPRPEGQIKALQRAYQEAGFAPTTLGLMEAHGTGTKAGDLCEVTALREVFGENNPRKQHIALGSVKSQIGHTKAAAGAAGLIKTILSLHHKVLPPTINVAQPNPNLKIDDSPFYVNTETRPWLQEGETPRRAGVSSFGFGGADYHVVLEEYKQDAPNPSYRLHRTSESLLLWDENLQQLIGQCETVLAQLETENPEQYYQNLLQRSQSALVPQNAARVGFVATSLEEARQLLDIALKLLKTKPQRQTWEHPRGIYYRSSGLSLEGKVVALFSGQGSQYLNMGKELLLNFPPLQQAYQQLDNLFIQDGLSPISQVVFPVPGFDEKTAIENQQRLQQTENAQPAIGALSFGLYKTLQQAGFKPDFVAGHSFGELSALWASGVLSDADYCYLIKARGQAMSTSQACADCDTGAMLAVNGDIAKVKQLVAGLSQVRIANLNAPDQIVLAGSKPEIATMEQILSKQGYSVTPLPVSAAFHTPFVSHASKPFAEALQAVTFQSPQIPVFANLSGQAYPQDPQEIRNILQDHLLNPVRFVEEIETIYGQGGYCFVEIGPRQILTNLVKKILDDRPHLAISLNPSRQKDSDFQLRQAVIQLRVAGVSIANFDPYQCEIASPETAKSKRLTVRLSGSNYISEKTKAAFAEACKQDEPSVTQPQILSMPSQVLLESIDDNLPLTEDSSVSIQSNLNPDILTLGAETMSNKSNSNSSNNVEKLFVEFCRHQSEVLRVHEQYLKHRQEFAHSFLTFLQQQNINPSAIPNVSEVMNFTPPTIDKAEEIVPPAVMNFVDKTEEIVVPAVMNSVDKTEEIVLPVVTNFVDKKEVETPQNNVYPFHHHHHPTPEVTSIPVTPVTARVAEVSRDSTVTQSLLNVVSDKTGYPSEMLELEMDMEADLGIDSIKRVEIIGAMQELFPALPKLSPDELAERRTLAQIAQYLESQLLVAEKKIA